MPKITQQGNDVSRHHTGAPGGIRTPKLMIRRSGQPSACVHGRLTSRLLRPDRSSPAGASQPRCCHRCCQDLWLISAIRGISEQDQQRAERGLKTDLTKNSTFEQLCRSLAPIVDTFRHGESRTPPGTPSCKARSFSARRERSGSVAIPVVWRYTPASCRKSFAYGIRGVLLAAHETAGIRPERPNNSPGSASAVRRVDRCGSGLS
jgi:hypothetical protein